MLASCAFDDVVTSSLEELLAMMTPCIYSRGVRIIEHGAEGNEIFFLDKGLVQVRALSTARQRARE